MSTTIGKKIRNIRESLSMGRQEFVEKTGIPKGTLIGIEQDNREPKAGILIAIAKVWPEYAAYLLTDAIDTKQKKPNDNIKSSSQFILDVADLIKKTKKQEAQKKKKQQNL